MVRALVPLVPGDEVTITYSDPLLPLPVRQQDLRSKYCFDCSCSRCLAEQAVLSGGSLEQRSNLPVGEHGQQQPFGQNLDVASTSAAAAAAAGEAFAAATGRLRLYEAVDSAQDLLQQGSIHQAITAVEPLLWQLLQAALTSGSTYGPRGMGWQGSAWSQPAVVSACVLLSSAYQQLAAAEAPGGSHPTEASPDGGVTLGSMPLREGCSCSTAARSASYSLLAVVLLTEWLLQGGHSAVHVAAVASEQLGVQSEVGWHKAAVNSQGVPALHPFDEKPSLHVMSLGCRCDQHRESWGLV